MRPTGDGEGMMADRTEHGRGKSNEAVGEGKSGARAAGDDLLQEVLDEVRHTGFTLLDEQKARVADVMHGIAHGMQVTADALRDKESRSAGYAREAASQVGRLSDSVRQLDFRTATVKAADVACRELPITLTASAALGFVGGRFLRASAERRRTAGAGMSATGEVKGAADEARRAADRFSRVAEDHPFVVCGFVLLAGALVAVSLPSTRTEDRLIGKTGDTLRDEAAEIGRDAMHRAERAAVRTTMRAAADAALDATKDARPASS